MVYKLNAYNKQDVSRQKFISCNAHCMHIVYYSHNHVIQITGIQEYNSYHNNIMLCSIMLNTWRSILQTHNMVALNNFHNRSHTIAGYTEWRGGGRWNMHCGCQCVHML